MNVGRLKGVTSLLLTGAAVWFGWTGYNSSKEEFYLFSLTLLVAGVGILTVTKINKSDWEASALRPWESVTVTWQQPIELKAPTPRPLNLITGKGIFYYTLAFIALVAALTCALFPTYLWLTNRFTGLVVICLIGLLITGTSFFLVLSLIKDELSRHRDLLENGAVTVGQIIRKVTRHAGKSNKTYLEVAYLISGVEHTQLTKSVSPGFDIQKSRIVTIVYDSKEPTNFLTYGVDNIFSVSSRRA